MIRTGLWGALWLLFTVAPSAFAQDSPGAMVAWIAEPWTRDGRYAVATADFAVGTADTEPVFAPPSDESWFQPDLVPSTFEEPILSKPSPFVPVPPFTAPPSCAVPAEPRFPLLHELWQDQSHYYSWMSQRFVLLAIGGGAALANTTWDQHFQDDVKFSQAVHGFKFFGEGKIFLPTYAVVAVAGRFFDDNTIGAGVGQWGERSLRAAAVGAPSLLFFQWMLGGSRPDESPLGSHWHPFADNNGVSGHAFMGAIPFLTAAKLTDRPLLKGGLFVGSWMAGASRITDDNHYLSQVIIGWSLAAVAVGAVNQTETGIPVRLFPWVGPGFAGVGCLWER